MKALEVKNLKVIFPTEAGIVRAVEGIDLEIEEGQCAAIVGESGCGKSVTSLAVMKLLSSPSAIMRVDTLKLNGNDIILEIDRMQENLLSSIATENISMRGCELYLNFLQFARELVNRYSIVAVLQHELNELCDRAKTDDKSEGKSGAKLEKPASHTGPQNILRALHVTGFGKKS